MGSVITAEQILLLRKSFHLVERHADRAAAHFYQQIFAMDPGLKPLFKTDVELQAMKLTAMLGGVLDLLERPIELRAELEDVGARHRGYGLKPANYSTVGTALIAMLERTLGESFTFEVRLAWVNLHHLVVRNMMRGGRNAVC